MRARSEVVCGAAFFSLSGGTFGGGSGAGESSIFSKTHLPRATGDVRLATEVTSRKLDWPSRPRRIFFESRRAGIGCRELRASRNAPPGARRRTCNPRSADPLHCDPRERCFRTTTRSRGGRPAQIVVERGRKRTLILQFSQVQPLVGEVGRQSFRARVRQHARACRSSTAGSCSLF